jgi:GR25 family glycosyltransferase involved in LPS biosynthesis
MCVNISNIPIYIIHYKGAVDRKNYLSEWLKNNELKATWMTDPDRNDLTEEIITQYYDQHCTKEWSDYPHLNRSLSKGEIACSIAHLNVYKDAIEKNYSNILVLEDDCQFVENFILKFNKLMKNVPDDYDVISLGSCCNLQHEKANTVTEPTLFKKLPPIGRCAFSNLLSLKCCKKIIERCIPFSYPMDWQAFVVASQHKHDPFNFYWVEPPITIDGENLTTVR